MALILAIDTATEVCSVALGRDGECLLELNNPEGNSHASQLHLMIEKLLKETGYKLNQIDAFSISKGPGSYTGLRVGVSAVKGFAYTFNKPVIGISSLKSLTNKFLKTSEIENGLLIPMIDARRMEVYTAVFSMNLTEIEPIQAKIIDNDSFLEIFDENKIYFFGNGSEKCKILINHPNARFAQNITCGAFGLISIAEDLYQKKQFENTAYFEPYYLKEFVGTTPKNKK
jgi:tRNA threonylcarbamoyladenosine biosynthesis protein TsaB